MDSPATSDDEAPASQMNFRGPYPYWWLVGNEGAYYIILYTYRGYRGIVWGLSIISYEPPVSLSK